MLPMCCLAMSGSTDQTPITYVTTNSGATLPPDQNTPPAETRTPPTHPITAVATKVTVRDRKNANPAVGEAGTPHSARPDTRAKLRRGYWILGGGVAGKGAQQISGKLIEKRNVSLPTTTTLNAFAVCVGARVGMLGCLHLGCCWWSALVR